jgi:hypothetical protein
MQEICLSTEAKIVRKHVKMCTNGLFDILALSV